MGLPVNNTFPFEIIAAPYTLYIAAVGTRLPGVDTVPDGSWTKVGANGPLNYLDEGVTVSHPQSFNKFRPLGDNGPRKIFRTEEDLMVRIVLVDVSLEGYRFGLNMNTITTTAAGFGSPGTKKIGLTRGLSVATNALLVRGVSPYIEDGASQYEVPVAVQTGSPETVYRRDEPAGIALQWEALVDPNATEQERFGRLIAQTSEEIT